MRARFVMVGRPEDAEVLSAMGFEFLYRARTDNAYVFINKPDPTEEEIKRLEDIPHEETNTVSI